jgi:hypothetical protein
LRGGQTEPTRKLSAVVKGWHGALLEATRASPRRGSERIQRILHNLAFLSTVAVAGSVAGLQAPALIKAL